MRHPRHVPSSYGSSLASAEPRAQSSRSDSGAVPRDGCAAPIPAGGVAPSGWTTQAQRRHQPGVEFGFVAVVISGTCFIVFSARVGLPSTRVGLYCSRVGFFFCATRTASWRSSDSPGATREEKHPTRGASRAASWAFPSRSHATYLHNANQSPMLHSRHSQ